MEFSFAFEVDNRRKLSTSSRLAKESPSPSLEDRPAYFGRIIEFSEDSLSIVLRMVTGDAHLELPLKTLSCPKHYIEISEE